MLVVCIRSITYSSVRHVEAGVPHTHVHTHNYLCVVVCVGVRRVHCRRSGLQGDWNGEEWRWTPSPLYTVQQQQQQLYTDIEGAKPVSPFNVYEVASPAANVLLRGILNCECRHPITLPPPHPNFHPHFTSWKELTANRKSIIDVGTRRSTRTLSSLCAHLCGMT
jgi:hypothetical protein